MLKGSKFDNVQQSVSHTPHYYKHSNGYQVTAVQLRQETAHSSNNTNVCQRPVPRSLEGRLAISLP